MIRINLARIMAKRIYSIDTMRIIAVACVVLIHTNPFKGVGIYGNIVDFLIETAARFAVPFFFMTAGYFFALKITRRDPTDYFIKRVSALSSIYGFGIVLAFPVFLTGTAVRTGVKNGDIMSSILPKVSEFMSPVELIYYGDSITEILWFLPALIFSFSLIYLFIRLDLTGYLLPISVGFHIVGLLGASYTMFIDVPFRIRDALFFGFFYTSLGYYIYSCEWQPNTDQSTLYLSATGLFGVLHIGERYVLGYVLTGKTFVQGVYSPEYTIGTALVTTSLFVFLLSRPDLGKFTSFPSWGKYAVGIYVAHPPVLYTLRRASEALSMIGYDIRNTILWHLVLSPTTFIGALLIYVTAHKLGVIEKGGIHLPRPGWIRNL